MQKLIKALMKAYLRIVNLFRKVVYPKDSKFYFEMSKDNFEKEINKFEYKADPIGGLIDYVDTPDHFFNPEKKSGRDCDDWARMWSLWGTYHGYQAREFVVCDPSSIKRAFNTMHVITVLKSLKYNKYFLCNYQMYGPFSTEEMALDYLKNWVSYQDNRLVVFSREIPKDPKA